MTTVTVLGIFACDLVWLADRLPTLGETVLGMDFRMGPGGKGSNQAVAARRAGAEVSFITRLGRDPFGDMARGLYAAEGIDPDHLITDPDRPTGAAFIYLDPAGNNAIIVTPGAAGAVNSTDVDDAEAAIRVAKVFVTQLETPPEVAQHGLALARRHGVTTVFNPAPAADLADDIYPLVDFFTPNETEAAALSGVDVSTPSQAETAADRFLAKGVGCAAITLGEQGVLVKSAQVCRHLPAFAVKAADTTGAGDAFNGGLAAALAEGNGPLDAVRFGCATAALSVTRPGTAQSMPQREAIDALLAGR